MPPENRGGYRQGTPGRAYQNRTDLNVAHQPAQTVPGQQYGKAKEQREAQQAIPLPNVTPLGAPTTRPTEPVTAGLPVGPGAGPEALNLGSADDDVATQIRALYQTHPSNDLLFLLEAYEEGL